MPANRLKTAIQTTGERSLEFVMDSIHATIPQTLPNTDAVNHCKVISHRGERSKPGVRENTFAAFDPLVGSKVWGLEFDVRWTADLQPVVLHDPDLKRVHDIDRPLSEVDIATLQTIAPEVPRLSDFIERYAAQFHLMMEIKSEPYPEFERQAETLARLFADYQPGVDFHLMSFDIELLDRLSVFPNHCKVGITRSNFEQVADDLARRGFGGIGAHYALISQRAIDHCHALGLQVGTGFPASKNGCWREINRGIRWLFSNQALKISQIHSAIAEKA